VAVDVESDIVIDRPITEVAAYASNPDNVPNWYTNISRVEWKSEPPVKVGSRIAFVAHFLGRTLNYTYEIVEWTPNERFVMRTAQGPFPMETTYRWEEAGEGKTRMRLRNRGEPSGFASIARPFMERAMRSANKKDLAALKRTLESA